MVKSSRDNKKLTAFPNQISIPSCYLYPYAKEDTMLNQLGNALQLSIILGAIIVMNWTWAAVREPKPTAQKPMSIEQLLEPYTVKDKTRFH
jgi:hypothetical protein